MYLGLNFLNSVTFFELVYTTTGVYKFLFAREIGMTFIADINFDGIALFGRTSRKFIAASAFYGYFMIIGMNFGFHQYSPLRI